jgi:hypothetical protein
MVRQKKKPEVQNETNNKNPSILGLGPLNNYFRTAHNLAIFFLGVGQDVQTGPKYTSSLI